jgi:hypothetical protein
MNNGPIDEMPDEIDFSQGVRGQFYRPNAKLNLPVYLDENIQARIARMVSDKGAELSEVIDDLMR